MKKLTFLLSLIVSSISAQDITGQWNGVLSVQGMQLRLVFHVSKLDSGYTSTMDSPDQGAKGIPVTTTTFKNMFLKFEVANAGIVYAGELKENSITGTFKQRGMTFPLNLSREEVAKKTMVRPQEPKQPYPYTSEDITFVNEPEKFALAGTLTLPQGSGPFPAVVLVSGSGPQNRDEELFGHKPFHVLADFLTRNGIAVLRYDDRGTGMSEGDYNTATTRDLALDAESAINYLQSRKEINKKKIGVIGHSEGGMIAPIVAERSRAVSFIVLLAGPGIAGDQLLLKQSEIISKAAGASDASVAKVSAFNKGLFEIIKKESDTQQLKNKVSEYVRQNWKDLPEYSRQQMSDEDFVKTQVNQLTSRWMTYFIKYDPAVVLRKVKCPVLAMNGEKDLQVPFEANLSAIKSNLATGGNKKVTTTSLPNLNHLFQECSTGLPAEYAQIEQTFSPRAMDEILKWMQNQNVSR